MEFIATYWWLWLAGVVVVLGVVAVRTVLNFLGMARDAQELAAKVRRVTEAAAGERSRELTSVALETAREKLKKRAVKAATNVVLLLIGGIFAILLAIAVVRNANP
ncbi:MAG: hypothetical protein QM775_35270 [Pirellulales bacterium]